MENIKLNYQTGTTFKFPANLRKELREVLNSRNVLMNNINNNRGIKCIQKEPNVEDSMRLSNFRSQAIKEIFTSELSYLEQLEKLMTFFVNPLKDNGILDIKSHTLLFGQIEMIYKLNKELLKELDGDMANLARAFVKFAPFLKLYSVYAFDYKNSLFLIQRLTEKNALFRSYLNETESRPEVQCKLNSLLIIPIQRVPRYRLLLNQVLLYTSPSEYQHKELHDSVKEIENTVTHINSVIEDQENAQKIINLHNAIVNKVPHMITPGRKVIMSGLLNKMSTAGSPLRRYCILLSDIFIYCKILKEFPEQAADIPEKSLECCCLFPLKKCKVGEIFPGKFKISCQGDGVIFLAQCEQESQNWLATIKDTIELHVLRRKTLRKLSSNRRPLRKKNIKNFDNMRIFHNKRQDYDKAVLDDSTTSNHNGKLFKSLVCLRMKKTNLSKQLKMQQKSNSENIFMSPKFGKLNYSEDS